MFGRRLKELKEQDKCDYCMHVALTPPPPPPQSETFNAEDFHLRCTKMKWVLSRRIFQQLDTTIGVANFRVGGRIRTD